MNVASAKFQCHKSHLTNRWQKALAGLVMCSHSRIVDIVAIRETDHEQSTRWEDCNISLYFVESLNSSHIMPRH